MTDQELIQLLHDKPAGDFTPVGWTPSSVLLV